MNSNAEVHTLRMHVVVSRLAHANRGGARRAAQWLVPLLLGAWFAVACAMEAPRLELRVLSRGHALAMNRPGALSDQRGRAMAVTRLDLLLTGFALQRPDGSWTDGDSWHGFFRAEQPSRREPLPHVAPGRYVAARFAVGVARQANHADQHRLAPDDPLHPVVNGLHWGWTGGYVFVALEGHWQFDHAPAGHTGGFSYHLAGDENLVQVHVPAVLDVRPGSVLRLTMDATRLAAGIDIAKHGESTHSRARDHAVEHLSAALRRSFTSVVAALPTASAVSANPPGSRAAHTRGVVPEPYRLDIGAHMPSVQLPTDNLPTVEGVALGERLFRDPRLSRDGRIACTSCHQPTHAFADAGRALSVGVDTRLGTRNAMPLFNLAWVQQLFWDGRVSGLRHQVLHPIRSPLEMGETLPRVVARLRADVDLSRRFERAFGGPANAGRIGLALEQYLLTLVSQDSKFDRVTRGAATFTPLEQRGFELFLTEHDPKLGLRGADCFHCHGGALFTNHRFANTGLPERGDRGREAITGQPADRGSFRTPSLRNVAVTGPYMHDGRFATLREVIDHYDRGVQRGPTLDPNLAKHPPRGLGLSDEDKAALVAFLETLTDPAYQPRERAVTK